MKIRILTIFFMVFVVTNLFADINDELANIQNKYDLVGFSVAVVKNNSIILSKHLGKSDVARDIDVSAKTVYRIASISKTITSTALMILYENNLVDINEDISKYLGYEVRNPNFPNTIITLKQLMTHTSSIRDGSTYSDFLSDSYGTDTPPGISEILLPSGEYYSSSTWSPYFAPGESAGWDYSNLASGIIASIVEKVSNMHFHEFCREYLFLPLGMNASFNNLNELNDINDLSVIYRYNQQNIPIPQADNYQGVLPDLPNWSNIPLGHNGLIYSPQGGVRCGGEDLAKFMQLHMNYGEYNGIQILQRETIELMHQIHWEGNGLAGFYKMKGLNVHITDDLLNGERMLGHAGEAYGLLSDMYFSEDHDFGIIFIMNGGKYGFGENVFYNVEEEVCTILKNYLLTDVSDKIFDSKFTIHPNPCNPQTTISLSLSSESQLSIDIYNLKGEFVKSIFNKTLAKGNYNFSWDGTDHENKFTASGIYLCKANYDGKNRVRKILLLK